MPAGRGVAVSGRKALGSPYLQTALCKEVPTSGAARACKTCPRAVLASAQRRLKARSPLHTSSGRAFRRQCLTPRLALHLAPGCDSRIVRRRMRRSWRTTAATLCGSPRRTRALHQLKRSRTSRIIGMSASGIGVVDLSSRSGWTGLLKAGERHSSPPTPSGLPWLALHTLTQCAVWRPIGRLGHWHPGSAKVAALLRPAIYGEADPCAESCNPILQQAADAGRLRPHRLRVGGARLLGPTL